MNGLILTQTTQDGRKKVWRLSPQKDPVTFGTSRKAGLISIDSQNSPFELVLEYKENRWHCIRFDLQVNSPDRTIEDGAVLKLQSSELKFRTQNKKNSVLELLTAVDSKAGGAQKNLILVSRDNQLLNSFMADLNEAVDLKKVGLNEKVIITPSNQWQHREISGLKISSKTLSTENLEHLKTIKIEDVFDSESKKASLITLAFGLVILAAAWLAPKKSTDLSLTQPLPTAAPLVLKTENKRRKPNPVKQSSQQASASSHDAKASALIKGSVGARISQLLGKVSATEARTKNILVSQNGVKADLNSTGGRALAAVGKVEASGRNWNGEAVGRGGGVGTVGRSGGDMRGLGSGLGQGKTGSGGVGLIEEESVITGGLDRDVIAQYIKTQLGQILYCYERQLSASPELFGKIAVKFIISGTGQVETQSINDTTLKNISVESCILSKIAKWKFPEPKGGTKVVVTYPFLFKSTN